MTKLGLAVVAKDHFNEVVLPAHTRVFPLLTNTTCQLEILMVLGKGAVVRSGRTLAPFKYVLLRGPILGLLPPATHTFAWATVFVSD